MNYLYIYVIIQGVFLLAALIGIIILIRKRLRDKETENFEHRDN